jgi:hypothetical protein
LGHARQSHGLVLVGGAEHHDHEGEADRRPLTATEQYRPEGLEVMRVQKEPYEPEGGKAPSPEHGNADLAEPVGDPGRDESREDPDRVAQSEEKPGAHDRDPLSWNTVGSHASVE